MTGVWVKVMPAFGRGSVQLLGQYGETFDFRPNGPCIWWNNDGVKGGAEISPLSDTFSEAR
jgi:hypothetical protein